MDAQLKNSSLAVCLNLSHSQSLSHWNQFVHLLQKIQNLFGSEISLSFGKMTYDSYDNQLPALNQDWILSYWEATAHSLHSEGALEEKGTLDREAVVVEGLENCTYTVVTGLAMLLELELLHASYHLHIMFLTLENSNCLLHISLMLLLHMQACMHAMILRKHSYFHNHTGSSVHDQCFAALFMEVCRAIENSSKTK